MKLLFDENISARLVKYFLDEFPDSNHIDYLDMQGATDTDIWSYAGAEGYIIVSKDNDFRQKSFLFGFPPKVVWLSVGNGGTKVIRELLLASIPEIKRFAENPEEGLLVLSITA